MSTVKVTNIQHASATNTAMVLDTAGTVKAYSTIGVGNATPSSSGAGITFPATQSASSDVNTLDDYEEGTWTPVLSRTGSSYTFAFQSGRYTKIGNIVICTFSISISAIGTQGSSYNQLSGLPFTPATLDSGNLRWTGSLSWKSALTSATNFYWSGATFFTDGSNALQTNFATGDMYGFIAYQV